MVSVSVHVCPLAFVPWEETTRLRFVEESEFPFATVNSAQAKFPELDPKTERQLTVWFEREG